MVFEENLIMGKNKRKPRYTHVSFSCSKHGVGGEQDQDEEWASTDIHTEREEY